MTLSEVAAVIGGSLEGTGQEVTHGVSIDTRTIKPGELFVALKAVRDGHDFLPIARERGASGAIVRTGADVPPALNVVRVNDPLVALGTLAAHQRNRVSAKVVAITGSAGKTSTKDFTASVLGLRYRVVASIASFNNEIGVPLTILSSDAQTEVIVAEVGARGVGHIRALIPMIKPDISIVTNIGAAHLGMFGSLDAIFVAKSELVEGLEPGGCAILNADDERVSSMKPSSGVDVLTFGVSGHADVRASDVALDEIAHPRFTLLTPDAKAEVMLPVPGEHMVSNALAAAAAGFRLGVATEQIATCLESVRTSEHRMRLIEAPQGWRILDDTYNASPASMVAALKALKRMGRDRRTWAVLGPMAELGDAASEQHDLIGRLVVRLGIGKLLTVDAQAKAMHEAARLEGMSSDDAIFVADATQAIEVLHANLERGDIVLVKAARVAGLERIVEAIAE
ncbi:MAG: UDP-N-acetylmuramoyl-tripeptide--D-alanyl-D-alanine ligase [Actinomycetota bacterium]